MQKKRKTSHNFHFSDCGYFDTGLNFTPLDCWILKQIKLFYLKIHVMKAWTSQNLIRICQAVAIFKILQVESTLCLTLERRKFNVLR